MDETADVENKIINAKAGDVSGYCAKDLFKSRNITEGARSSLIKAVEIGDVKATAKLIAQGVNVNDVTSSNNTPLKIAAKRGHEEIIRLLIRAGANVDAVSSKGMTALMLASGYGHLEVVRLLLAAGAEVERRTVGKGRLAPSKTAISMARHHGHHNIVRLLENNRKSAFRGRLTT